MGGTVSGGRDRAGAGPEPGLRDEYKFSARTYAFVEARYSRDRFKDLSYLISPLAGAGYRTATEPVQVSLDAALGGAFEKLRGRAVTSSGALRAAQTLTWKPTPTATLSQGASALWKLGDFGDAFYRLDAGCALSMSKRLELKLTLQGDFKTRPPDPRIQKRDDVLITALVFKL